ncbi:MFS transporter [Bifidobacterium oedipodis]|uniref:MFS transporter n=1 Tax=Bifidobacterium oedipodis TaxID=2675322 RepID=A0A7Y0ER93_9BIFI|nr:MFS transporter [Bifidobacterium sp. DSM 109957]NMM94973.1 MFS transporter [Bifidobacterium sp. DSM 109957]
MSNQVIAGIREVTHKVFGGYAELLRIPHTARYSIGSVIACMPFPMVGMTITISVQHYYGNYSLAGLLTAVQAIALALATPLLGKLTDKFGQRQVSIPTIIVWIIAAISLVTCITNRAPEWVLFCITPFMAAIPPWGAMSRARWTRILKGDHERTNRALSLCGVLDECMWVIGNPLASTLAVISGLLAFSFTGVCVVIGALMFLTELSTEPPSQTDLARADGITRKEYREREAARAEALKAETAAEETRRRLKREGVTDQTAIDHAVEQAVADARSGKKQSIWGPGLVAVCITWFSLGAFQSATSISIIAFATEQNMKQYTGFVFACFSISSLIGALVYGAKNWHIPLWKRFYFCLAVVNIGIGTFMFAKHLWVIMLIYLLIGVCQAPTWINGNQLMLHLVPPSRLTEGMAWMGAMNSIGSSAGSAIAGQFIDRMGSHGGFMVVTVLALSSLVIAFLGFKQIKTSTEQPTLTEVAV